MAIQVGSGAMQVRHGHAHAVKDPEWNLDTSDPLWDFREELLVSGSVALCKTEI